MKDWALGRLMDSRYLSKIVFQEVVRVEDEDCAILRACVEEAGSGSNRGGKTPRYTCGDNAVANI